MGPVFIYGAAIMFGWFRRAAGNELPVSEVKEIQAKGSLMSTHRGDSMTRERARELTENLRGVWQRYLRAHAPRPMLPDGTMDDDDSQGWNAIKSAYTMGQPNMSDALFQWFGTQSFLGHQACAILMQHWLVKKICITPARDAIRQGYEIINEVGEAALTPKVIAEYAKYDKAFQINKHLLQYFFKGRVFGIRVAIPVIRSPDPDFYEKPFNPDGILPGSFKGWVQVDPYWMAPQLDAAASSQPDSPDFYEPTWWQINGKRYHRSHLCIFRTEQPVDLLKPSYLYSGIPVPQAIMERVYGAERTANEAPLLAMTKRLQTFKSADVEAIMLDKEKFDESMAFMTDTRDNYGVRVMGSDDEFQQFDTSLADLANVIDGQYALACAAGDVPVNKIMGLAAGGALGNGDGGYDQESYRETLESLQTHEGTPLLERHHLLVKMSYIIPKFGDVGRANTTVSWMPLDSPDAKEYAEINELNARADVSLCQTGAISDSDVNTRLRNDKNSGYNTIRPIVEGEREPSGAELDDDLELGTPQQNTGNDDGASAT